ncbi:MAG: GNAT family N-acetyltransferase [Candidatus Hodarchaeota archaeon]
MALKISKASYDDKNEIYEALINYSKELEQYQEYPSGLIASNKYFNLYWTETDRFPFVAYIADKLVGFCLLRVEESYYSIAEFYIKPNFRRQGYGKSLLNYIIEFCKEQGKHSSIIADSFIKNSIAKNFWNANGFITINEIIFENEKSHRNLKEIHIEN